MSKQCVLSPYAIKTPAAPEISPESCILYQHKGLEKRTLHRYVAPTKGIVVGQKTALDTTYFPRHPRRKGAR